MISHQLCFFKFNLKIKHTHYVVNYKELKDNFLNSFIWVKSVVYKIHPT